MSEPLRADAPDLAACVVRAVTLYALAEFQSGHARTIRVGVEGASFSVADDGRGHAIERTVGASPYLKFVYTHLDYPFDTARDAAVQLHGIGMSLVTVLCSELVVTAHKRDATLRMTFRNGSLCSEERTPARSEQTGNTVSGTVAPRLGHRGADAEAVRRWLLGVRAAHPALGLHFNGRELLFEPPGKP